MEEELARRVMPAERAVMMRQVSKTVRTAMGRVKPPAMIKVKKNQGMKRVEEGIRAMTRWARITILNTRRPPAPPKFNVVSQNDVELQSLSGTPRKCPFNIELGGCGGQSAS